MRKTATNGGMPDDLENKPATRTLRSKKSVLLVSEKMDNCKVVIEKLKSDFVNTVRHAKIGRKRRRVESEDEAVIEEEEQEKEEKSTAKRTRIAKKKIEAKGEASSGSKQEVHYTSTRERRTVKYTEESQGFSSHSEEENDNENSSDSESGLASGHKSSSSSLSVSTDGESDSPIPTSELSDSSHQINNSSDELSSSNSDIITWRTRKSPRKKAQASSRKKIAELCDRLSDSEDMLSSSPSSSEASQSE